MNAFLFAARRYNQYDKHNFSADMLAALGKNDAVFGQQSPVFIDRCRPFPDIAAANSVNRLDVGLTLLLFGTKRIFGLCTASQMAATSVASVLLHAGTEQQT